MLNIKRSFFGDHDKGAGFSNNGLKGSKDFNTHLFNYPYFVTSKSYHYQGFALGNYVTLPLKNNTFSNMSKTIKI